MNIEDLANTLTDSAVLTVTHPVTGLPLKMKDDVLVTLSLAGMDSDRYRAADRENTNNRLKLRASGARVKMTAEELEAEALEIIVACTVGWTGVFDDGEEVPFSAANVRTLYTKVPWLRQQADVFIHDRANFLNASATI